MQWPRSTTPPFSRMDDSAKPIGFLAKLWHHRPGSRSPDESFVPGMPATPRATYITNPVQPTSDDYYTSFLKFDKSPRKTKEQSGYGRPNISSPTPLDRPDIGDHTGTRPQTPPTPITDGLSPAMAAALSGRTISPLAQLRDGGELINRSSDAEEGRSYLPKMTGFASMFPRSQLRQQESGQEDSSWKRPSVDTIGQIFGNYGSGTPKSGQEFDMVTAEQRREKWDQRVRNGELTCILSSSSSSRLMSRSRAATCDLMQSGIVVSAFPSEGCARGMHLRIIVYFDQGPGLVFTYYMQHVRANTRCLDPLSNSPYV